MCSSLTPSGLPEVILDIPRKNTISSEDNEELYDTILDLKDSKSQFYNGSSFKDILNNTKKQPRYSQGHEKERIPDSSSTIYNKTGSVLSKKE